jgi:thermostable 8-oxoguanine DNA glycosylase
MSATQAPDTVAQYRQNKDVYDEIANNVRTTVETFEEADRELQEILLHRAVSFALISAQTSVPIHEKGYLNVVDETQYGDIEEGLYEAGVNYYRNKSKYILHNMTEPDYDRVLDHYENGEIDKMHRAIADEFKGVGLRKAAYAMAKVVTTDKCCVDTHIAQFIGLETDEIYNGVVVDKYENQCQRLIDKVPDEIDHLSRFMKQWVAFDAQRGSVTTHDAWFASLPREVGVNPPGWE